MGLFGLVSEWWPPSDDRAQCGKRGIDFNEDAFAEKRGEIVVAVEPHERFLGGGVGLLQLQATAVDVQESGDGDGVGGRGGGPSRGSAREFPAEGTERRKTWPAACERRDSSHAQLE